MSQFLTLKTRFQSPTTYLNGLATLPSILLSINTSNQISETENLIKKKKKNTFLDPRAASQPGRYIYSWYSLQSSILSLAGFIRFNHPTLINSNQLNPHRSLTPGDLNHLSRLWSIFPVNRDWDYSVSADVS